MSVLVEATRENIAAELERRRRGEDVASEAARLSTSLSAFVAAAWHVLEPANPYQHNWHIDAISEALEAAKRRDVRRLIINVPPRHMKSMSACVLWQAWWWTTEPWVKFLCASYSQDFAWRDSDKSRRLIESDWYRQHWPAIELRREVSSKSRWENTKSGYRISGSILGLGTGEGGDVILLDDPHKVKTIESESEREAVIDYYDGTLPTRLNDPKTGVKVIVMQRLHERDLVGHVLEREGWEHLCLPATYDPSHPYAWRGDPRTEVGELLWPERFDAKSIGEIAEDLGPYRAAGQLQQLPSPREGSILRRAAWRYFPKKWLDDANLHLLPTFSQVITSWDTSFKDKTSSDYVVGTVWGIAGGKRYLLRRDRDRLGLDATKARMLEQRDWVLARWPRAGFRLLVEHSANGVEIVEYLKREIPGVTPVKLGVHSGNKTTRAEAAEPDLESGSVLVPGIPVDDEGHGSPDSAPGWARELIDECAAFPHASHDDQVDSFTQAINWARLHSAKRGSVASPARRPLLLPDPITGRRMRVVRTA